MKVISCAVDSKLAERLEAEAAAVGISLSSHLRNILDSRDRVNNLGRDHLAALKESKKGFLERLFS